MFKIHSVNFLFFIYQNENQQNKFIFEIKAFIFKLFQINTNKHLYKIYFTPKKKIQQKKNNFKEEDKLNLKIYSLYFEIL